MLMVLAALAAAPAAQAPSADGVTSSVLRAGALPSALKLDGLLDEPAWRAADSTEILTMVEPIQGGAPTVRTVIRVLAGAHALVIGIRCDDPDPSAIVAYSLQRDPELRSEDHVTVVLDPFLDGRSGYVFAVNPRGSRFDALVTHGGGGTNAEWDAIWEAGTARTARGWSVEIRIPIHSLGFRRGLTTWGFNVERRVQRLQETDRWAGARRDWTVYQTSRAGRLTDLPPFGLGLGLSVRPSITGGGGVPSPDSSFAGTSDVSLDVTQRLAANALASLTVNTDFAETEVDTRRTNLTRFPLFFPEKRTFFLSGSDIFDFGAGLGRDVVPFFSRRIGLLGDREIPLAVGGKVIGRAGGTSFGALAVRTRADTVPAASLGALRIRRNVLDESSVGIIATGGDPATGAGHWLAGPDLTFQTSRFQGGKNLVVGVWGLATGGDTTAGQHTAGGIMIDYPNDLWNVSLAFRRVGDAFQPSLGFVPRPGTYTLNASVNYEPRPGWSLVRQMFFESFFTYITDLDGRWQSWRLFTAPVNWRLESGDRFEFNVAPQGERLDQPFEVAQGVVLPPGSYRWPRFRLEGGLAAKRRFSAQATWWFGGFYRGSLHQLQLEAFWRPSPLLTIELNGERNIGRLPEGSFTADLLGVRLRLNLAPTVELNSLVQYDNGSRSFGSNSRLRWTFRPEGDLFVVYDHNLEEVGDRWGFASNQLLVKLQYALRY